MHTRKRVRALALIGLTAMLILIPALAASAHEARTIGPLDVEVGFGTEPADTGQPNSVFLSISKNGKPVNDLGNSVKVEITFGDQTSDPMPLEPGFGYEDGKLEFGEPGTYDAYFTPSEPGKYTFHFTGTYQGTKIDESFTSSPGGFDEVVDPVTFPAVTAPTNEELAARIDQETARTDEAVAAATSAADSAESAASSAKTLAIVGVVLGAIGIIAAIGALATRKRA